MPATLYLIPCPLGPTTLDQVLPEQTRRIAAGLTIFAVEQARSARAFLKQVGTEIPLQQLTLLELSEHTRSGDLEALLAHLLAGHDVGLISEAGCPAVADPGADLVRLAHAHGIRVRPLVGPSSILLALMASGLVGQRFTFHGYLPVKQEVRANALRVLERQSQKDDATQIFIETPYRNTSMLEAIVTACQDDTLLCVACDLTLQSEYVATRRVADWHAQLPELDKRPCVFTIYRPSGRRLPG